MNATKCCMLLSLLYAYDKCIFLCDDLIIVFFERKTKKHFWSFFFLSEWMIRNFNCQPYIFDSWWIIRSTLPDTRKKIQTYDEMFQTVCLELWLLKFLRKWNEKWSISNETSKATFNFNTEYSNVFLSI